MKRIFPFIMIPGFLWAQSIRKEVGEMDLQEMRDYVAAIKDARFSGVNGTGGINNLMADFHLNNFGAIHNEVSSLNVFFSWHRHQIHEYELQLQRINGSLSVPYWDCEQHFTKKNWMTSVDFMGAFNNWTGNGESIQRVMIGSLNHDLSHQQDISDWYTYRTMISSRHGLAHNWVGGVMGGGFSPFDPIFYLHHANVDALWQDWEENHPEGHVGLQRTDLPWPSSGTILPNVNPNTLNNSDALGVFYSKNHQVRLKNYTVTNQWLPIEKFVSKGGQIEVSQFQIPTNKIAEIKGVNVVLKSGFKSVAGSKLKIQSGYILGSMLLEGSPLQRMQKELNFADQNTPDAMGLINQSLGWQLPDLKEQVQFKIFNLQGIMISSGQIDSQNYIPYPSESGQYFIQIIHPKFQKIFKKEVI